MHQYYYAVFVYFNIEDWVGPIENNHTIVGPNKAVVKQGPSLIERRACGTLYQDNVAPFSPHTRAIGHVSRTHGACPSPPPHSTLYFKDQHIGSIQ